MNVAAILTSKTFWIIIAIIVLIIIIVVVSKKAQIKYTQLTQPKQIILLPGENATISPERQTYIQLVAKNIFDDIQDTPVTGHNYEPYKEALNFTDNELNFMADYYFKYLSLGKSLYSEIDTQYYITGNEPNKLMNRLASIGKR